MIYNNLFFAKIFCSKKKNNNKDTLRTVERCLGLKKVLPSGTSGMSVKEQDFGRAGVKFISLVLTNFHALFGQFFKILLSNCRNEK